MYVEFSKIDHIFHFSLFLIRTKVFKKNRLIKISAIVKCLTCFVTTDFFSFRVCKLV